MPTAPIPPWGALILLGGFVVLALIFAALMLDWYLWRRRLYNEERDPTT